MNSLLPPVVKTHSKATGIFSLVPLPKIDQLYAVLNGSAVHSSLDCISGYHNVLLLSPEAEKKSAFATPIRNFEFTKVPLSLAKEHVHIQQLINEVIEGLLFAFG